MTLRKLQAWPLVRNAFPGYKGRKFHLEFTETVLVHNTHWEGGSRNYYAIVKLGSDFQCQAFPEYTPWANPIEGERFPMRLGFALVKHSLFCGRDLGITIYAHPANRTMAFAA